MKLKHTSRKSMDLKQSIWSRIVEEFGEEIPIITSLPKDDKTFTIQATIPLRFKRMGERIMAKGGDRYRVYSDIVRAVNYIGYSVLYHMHEKKGEITQEAEDFWDHIQASMEFVAEMERVEASLTYIQNIVEAHLKGIITREKMEKKVEKLLNFHEFHVQDFLKNQIGRILNGEKVVSLDYRRTWGRKAKNE